MRNLAVVFFALSVFSLTAQTARTVVGSFTDALYVPAQEKIYALTPGVGVQGNSICRIDPTTATVETCFFVGSEPRTMALSPDGNSIYVGMFGENKIVRFDLMAETVGLTFSTGGEGEFSGPFYAEDILPLRNGKQDALAVALQNSMFSPRHEGVAVFEAGMTLANRTPGHTGSNSITYTDEVGVLIGYNNETTDFGLRRMVVDENGITVTGEYQLFDGFDRRIEYAGGQLYSSNGQRANLANGVPSAAGRFVFPENEFQPRAVEALPEDNRVFFVHEVFQGNYRLEEFNRTTSTFLEQKDFTAEAFGDPLELFHWGDRDKLAYVTRERHLVILESCAASLAAPDEAPVPTDSIAPCVGEVQQITLAKGAPVNGSVVWENGFVGDTLSVTETGVYRYAFRDENGCVTAFSPALYVEFFSPPFSPQLAYNAAANVLASTHFGHNRWFLNGELVAETPNAFYTPTASGFYTVVAVDPCPSGPSNAISVIISSTEDPTLRAAVRVYPNPVGEDNILRVQAPRELAYRVELFERTGRSVLRGEGVAELDLGHLPTGLYVLRLTDVRTGRFIRERVVKR